jgi:hypothetical protein
VKSRAPSTPGVTAGSLLAGSLLLGSLLLGSLLAGCTASEATPDATSAADASSLGTLGSVGELGPGFYDAATPPAPESTISPAPGSWSAVHPPEGYSVVLLTHGDDAQTRTLESAVRTWAADEGVALQTLVPASDDTLLSTTTQAIERKPDLIISVGNGMVDALAAITPSTLSQLFLVVGAELAEPTSNVTAVDWTGAGYRGEGLGTPTDYDPATFTPERADRALRAGVAAVLHDYTGIVLWVD